MSAYVAPEADFGPARTLRLGLSRVRYEVRSYFRQLDSVFFTFLFPVLFLLIFAVAFASQNFGPPGHTIGSAQFYLPGMLAAGLLLSGLQNMSLDIAMERSDGTLKRLGGTPLGPAAYFIGKIGQVFVTGALQSALLIVVAGVAFGVPLPTDPARWATFAWVFLLGVTTCAVLGIGLSALPRSGRSATGVVVPIVLVLQFVSGVYIDFAALPTWLQNVASVFPLKWLAQGLRSVFLPESFAAGETVGSWQLPEVALVTGLWLVFGLAVVRVSFRWIRRDT
ncbi:ABC transporter permease [Microbacterium sp. SORGH_AS_0888]|uniref:ABC transporter permease n=1 Tax=Microbacterium sp. SORGH_AS_0888 TaxID=3041791 RepID=UPI00277F5C20|nr:ABC transporter permease [Microbacterium sp. SORGH_AS_0888]MDQ1129511.1 ABC-2 type transport system permease protein [Microbacterium sp. SORGH_AS_0888]